MGQDKQGQSWSSVWGVRDHPNLVAQIFFPTGNSSLDADDQSALDTLVSHYRIALLGERVSLKFVGHADYRGSDQFNKALGMRRAKSVQAYMELHLRTQSRYFSSSVLSMGEQGASRTDLTGDRRVDVFSSYIPPRPVIQLPPITIVGKIPKRQVKRPVRFVDIERSRIMSDGPHEASGSPWHVIVVEEYGTFDEDRTVPFDLRQEGHDIYKYLPVVQVYRYRIDWKKSTIGDTAKSVAETALKIISGALDTTGDWDLSGGIPKLEPPNMVYGSWADYIAHEGNDEISKKYQGKF